MSYAPILLQRGLHVSVIGSGCVLTAWSATSMVVALAARRLPDRLRSQTRLAVGLTLCAAGEVALSQLPIGASWALLMLGLVMLGIGSGVANAALGRLAVESVPHDRAGVGSGDNKHRALPRRRSRRRARGRDRLEHHRERTDPRLGHGRARLRQPVRAAATWLGRALAMDLEDRGLLNAAHEEARRHWGPDPAAFDQDWARRTGMPVPAWLTVDSALLSSARAWVATDTYTAERDYLAAHPELLEAAADTAVAEALLALPEDVAGRYAALRQAAQHDGADAAYRPLLLTILAREFADAGPARQRALLADRADDLLTGTVTDALNELAGQEDQQAVAAQRATALLDLARAGDAEAVLEALTEPGRFPRLLHELVIRVDAASTGPAALVAYTAATTVSEAATAVF